MLYYAYGLTLVGGIESTPLLSLLSKCVDVDEFGRIFTLSSVTGSVAGLLATAVIPKLYNATVDYLPGAMYFFMSSATLATVIGMTVLYVFIIRHETVHGPLGADQDKMKSKKSDDRVQE